KAMGKGHPRRPGPRDPLRREVEWSKYHEHGRERRAAQRRQVPGPAARTRKTGGARGVGNVDVGVHPALTSVFRRSSARRSQLSVTPDSIPDATMLSRSSTVAYAAMLVTFVLPPSRSNVAVWVSSWSPGLPSNTKVDDTRVEGWVLV